MSSIRVVCRFRPQNKIELAQGGKSIITVSSDNLSCHIKGAESDHTFAFDRVFSERDSQRDVYDDAAKPVIEDVLQGYNGTIFVYGQTSSGKTHTMQGPSIDDPELRGIIPRMINTVFEGVMNADENIEFLVKASYLEIYMERIRDLLDVRRDNLKVREDKGKGVWVEGATEVYVSKEQDVLDIIRTGQSNRAIASTKMNAESSRSHSIFVLGIGQKNLRDGASKSGKLYLVDLAGSEKVGKTGAQGTTLDEAKMINKSLSALGNVINALTDGKASHVPYRDSRLTRILQESLGGNSRTTLIINCSPSSYNEPETLSTLRFGSRAKNIKNKAKVNQERSAAELKVVLAKAEAEIERLKKYIETLEQITKGGGDNNSPSPARPQTVDGASGAPKAKSTNSAVVQEKFIELEKKYLAQEEEKKALQDQLDSINESIQEKEAELVGQTHIVNSTKEELHKSMVEIQSLTKENGQLSMQFGEMKMALELAKYETTQKDLSLETLSTENFTLKSECEELRERITALEEAQTILEAKQTQHQQQISPSKNASLAVQRHSMEWTQKEQEIQRELQESIKAFEATMHHEEEPPAHAHVDTSVSGPSWAEEQSTFLQSRVTELEEQLKSSEREREARELQATLALQEKESALNAKIEKLQEQLLLQQQVQVVEEAPTPAAPTTAPATQEEQKGVVNLASSTPAVELGIQTDTTDATSTTHVAAAVPVTAPQASTSDVDELRNSVELAGVEVTHLSSENEKLRTQVHTLETTIKTAEEGARVKLEAEMKKWQTQTTTKLQEFAAIREALLLDLENRCQKVIDLEMLLDDAQDKYHGLLNQLKKTGGKTQQHELQQKLDEVTAARHQLSIDSNKLKLEVQVATKQLALRDEHIASLEALLKDTQERFHKLARAYEAVADELARFKSEPQETTANVPHKTSFSERIAKPLRGGGGLLLGGMSSAAGGILGGGGGKAAANRGSSDVTTLPSSFSPNTPTIPRSPSLSSLHSTPSTPTSSATTPSTPSTPASIWDIFKGKKAAQLTPKTPSTPSHQSSTNLSSPASPFNPLNLFGNTTTSTPTPTTTIANNVNTPLPSTPPPANLQSYAPAFATTPASPSPLTRGQNNNPHTPTR